MNWIGGTEECEEEECVFAVSDNVNRMELESPKTIIKINDAPVRMMTDSGAKYTLLPENIWRRIGPKWLNESDINPSAYGGVKIDIMGWFEAKLAFKDRTTKGKVYVSRRGTMPLLSWTHQAWLKVRLDASAEQSIYVIESNEMSTEEVKKEVFKEEIGCAKGIMHRIQLKRNCKPVAQKLRNVPLAMRDEVKRELKKLEEQDIIEKIDASEWVSPLVVVRKSSGKVRVCIDLRELNKCIIPERHPLPNIQELLSTMGSARVFSTLDLTSAYHQIRLHEDSRHLTAFITPEGLYQYKRMPFGLISAASVFQKTMHHIFDGDEGIIFFQDDILIFAKDQAEHDKILDGALRKLYKMGMTLSKEKSKIHRKQIEYLGHVISEQGTTPKPELMFAINNMATPSNKEELRTFLGMAEYYSKYIRRFADHTAVLRDLTRINVKYEWNENCEKEFNYIKSALTTAPALKNFVRGQRTVITTDASNVGLGAVLAQIHNGEEKVIAFASRLLKGAEKSYATIEKEALAIVWAVDKFRSFVWGTQFEINTDHKPLVELFTNKGLDKVSARIRRWVHRMQEFNVVVKYIPGVRNYAADCLSRLTNAQEENKYESEENQQEMICMLQDSAIAKEEWLEGMNEDVKLQFIIRNINNRHVPLNKIKEADVQGLWSVRDELSVQGGYLFRGDRLIPPANIRKKIIELGHEGHQGISKTKSRIRNTYWWPGCDAEIERIIRNCILCNKSDKGCVGSEYPMVMTDVPSRPWMKVGIDIMGPIWSEGSQTFCVVIIDILTRWAEVKMMPGVTTKNIINFLEEVCSREGYPGVILSDNGPQFVSSEMGEYLKQKSIKHITSAVYHPQTNGVVERYNKILKNAIRWAWANGMNWKESVRNVIMAHRFTPHSSTGVSPFELSRGRKATTKLCPGWMGEVINMGVATDNAVDMIRQKQYRNKAWHDKKRFRVNKEPEVGCFVRIKLPEALRVRGIKWSDPIQVIELFKHAVRTSDGRVWNMERVMVVNGIVGGECMDKSDGGGSTENQELSLPITPIYVPTGMKASGSRFGRKYRRPMYLTDYGE